VQIVPALQPLAKQLVLFQRTPAWVMPKVDPEYTQQQQAAWWFPAWLALRRVATYLFNELIFGRAVVGNDPKFAEAVSEAGDWCCVV
jgi:cation diffusion facilitator CzcD-associated flavoprotein CzcO